MDVNAPKVSGGSWDSPRLLGRRGLRIGLGVIWILDGLLQAEGPKFAGHYPLGTLAQSAMGSPAWVGRSVLAGLHPFVPLWPMWNLGAVLFQIAIGICLVSGRCTRLSLAASVVWALGIWWVGESFGMLASGYALMEGGAPGPALLYAVLGVMAWPRAGRRDLDRRAFLAVWTTLWAGAAFLHLPLVYSSRRVLEANLSANSLGSPRYLADLSSWLYRIVAGHAPVVVAAAVVIELVVGLGWLAGQTGERLTLLLALVFSAFCWIVVQQIGGIFTSGGTDPSLGPLVMLLALGAWPQVRTKDRGRSVDRRTGLVPEPDSNPEPDSKDEVMVLTGSRSR